MGRLDWNISSNLHFFYRFNYFSNVPDATFFPRAFGSTRIRTTHESVAGLDITTGNWTHTIRFSEMHFENNIAEAVVGSSLLLANLRIHLNVNNGPQTGPNLLAPQATLEHDSQAKYDGGKPIGTQFVRFGVNYKHIEWGGFATFFEIAPQVVTSLTPTDVAAASTALFPGGSSNPLNYPVEVVIFGDGQGYSTEKPGLDYPAGLLGPDNRFAALRRRHLARFIRI